MLLLWLLSAGQIHAQDLLKGKDLSQVQVDQLTDADIAKLKAQMASAGMTIDQAQSMALSKGMNATEFAKLKDRLAALDKNTNGVGKLKDNTNDLRQNNSTDLLDTANYPDKKSKTFINPLIFGSELYSKIAPSFEPNLKLATPLNYVLGPDDQVQVLVYGVQQYDGDLQVSAEGSITIPSVGQVKVAGLTIEAATQKLKTILGNGVYPYLKSGGSKLSVTLSKIRSIKVTVVGSNLPGNKTISSLATVFNALYVAGGPTEFGSFREIELIRNNKVIDIIDLYKFLLQGDQTHNVGLKDNDVIRIPPYRSRVELQGQVKRPGIYEVLPGEHFSDILDDASGFTDTAYTASVKVLQRNDTERKLHDLVSAEYTTYAPVSGDVFVASKILNRYQNRVKITGAVYRPDIYELSANLHVADLIRKADGLREDAFTGRGQILRLEEDLTRSILSFDIRKALQGDAENNPLLKREDEVLISSIQDLRDSFKVTIQGEIRIPGQYDYVDKLTLKDLIVQAGGFTDAAYKNVEIARLIKRDSIIKGDNRASNILQTEINGDLSSVIANLPLQPFDVITIRKKAGYTLPESVIVEGQVQYPGPYALSSRNERVSDVLKRAGGATPDAYLEGAYLKRYKTDKEKEKSVEVLKKLQKNIKDKDSANNNTLAEDIKREYDQIPLDLAKILQTPGSVEDMVLRSKDELYIPKFDAQIKISGAVLLTTQVPYRPENSLKNYISDAGGFAAEAWKRKTYIVYANGRAATAKHFLFFKYYPKVKPGSEIVVPKKAERKGGSALELISMASAVASLAGVIIAIIKL
jgi:protein involved in polysaccharide export with SLBB domain